MSDRIELPHQVVDWVERLHAAVDEAALPVARVHATRLNCRLGCTDCCSDDLTVFEIEAAVIQRHYAELLQDQAPHPPGACAFLDATGGCRIYEHRPYVCRTQGLPLRWLEEVEAEDGSEGWEIVEGRDICPKNVTGGPPLEELSADECWTIGPFEQRLADRQAELAHAESTQDGASGRVSLRSLFRHGDARRRLPVVR